MGGYIPYSNDRIATLERQIAEQGRVISQMRGMLGGNGSIINHGKRFNVDESTSLSQILSRIHKAEVDIISVSDSIVFKVGDKFWIDLKTPLTRSSQGALDKPDYSTVDLGLLFPQNKDSEIAYLEQQADHGIVKGAVLKSHVHYFQDGDEQPTYKMDYRLIGNGKSVPSSFTTLSTADNEKGVFDYIGSKMLQIAAFPDILIPDDIGLSYFIDIKLYRDDNDVTGDVLTKQFDIHVQIDKPGSDTEFLKDA